MPLSHDELLAKVADLQNTQAATMLLIKHIGWDGKTGSAIDWVVARVAELEGENAELKATLERTYKYCAQLEGVSKEAD